MDKFIGNSTKITGIFFIISVFLSGCLGSRHLEANQEILYKQEIKIASKIDVPITNNLLKPAETNNRLFGIFPIYTNVWLYYLGKKKFSKEKFEKKLESKNQKFDAKLARTTKPKLIASIQYRKQQNSNKIIKKMDEGNTLMQWGEPLVIFDSASVGKNIDNITQYLHSKGYFFNTVTASVKHDKRRLALVKYAVHPKQRYRYDSIFYDVQDTAIEALIKRDNKSLLRKGDGYDEETLSNERERLDALLRNNGYFNFSRDYISFGIDSAFKVNCRIAVRVSIAPPLDAKKHKIFMIDSVVFQTEEAPEKEQQPVGDHIVNNINFRYAQRRYKEEALARRIFVQKGSLYSQKMVFKTQRKLSDLDVFKFINVNYDTTRRKMVANILASPLDNYQFSHELGMTIAQGYPGPYYSVNLQRRNIFKSFASLDFNVRFGIQGVAPATNVTQALNSTEFVSSLAITFPNFLIPFTKRSIIQNVENNPKTRLSASYAITERPEYRRSITSFSGTYSWEKGERWRFSFSPLSLNIVNTPRISEAFKNTLDNRFSTQNQSLSVSFSPSFVSSVVFSATWFKNLRSKKDHSTFIQTTFESGGTLLNLTKSYSDWISQRLKLIPFQFLRLQIDYRKNYVISPNSSFAYHVNVGIAKGYGETSKLPYEKYFFAGGSNSVRAWRPRRLGPGEVSPPVSENISKDGYFDYSFEKPGQVLLESSIEFRRKLIGFINYAFFIDIGNIWLLYAVQNTPNPNNSTNTPEQQEQQNLPANYSKFDFGRFYKQFGVGTGVGLRLDFSYLIVRFDIGIKAWDPARPSNERFVLPNLAFFGPYSKTSEPVIYNFGIGYPF